MNERQKTVLRDWYIIKILDENELLIGQLLWGFVVEDETHRFDVGDYVCTSAIETIKENVIITAKNRQYCLDGNGKEFEACFDEVDLLRRGYSPEQVTRLR